MARPEKTGPSDPAFTVLFMCLFRQLKCSGVPDTILKCAWCYRLALGERNDFAMPRDAFPFTSACKNVRNSLPSDLGDFDEDTVSVWSHEFGKPVRRSDFATRYAMNAKTMEVISKVLDETKYFSEIAQKQ